MEIWKEASRFIAKTRTSTLISSCFLISFICILPLSLTGEYKGSASQDILISLIFFLWGLAGLPIIIRQDADFGLFRIEGLVAAALGVVLMICSFALALLLLW